MSGEFSVYLWFPDGTYMAEERWVDAETAVRTAKRLTESVGGRIGTIHRIIIVDADDFTNFEWQYGKGVTFPQPDNQPTKPNEQA